MNRAAISKQILDTFNDDTKYQCIVDSLTDLFIQLSTERCQEQKELCEVQYCRIETHRSKPEVTKAIRTAPLPALD